MTSILLMAAYIPRTKLFRIYAGLLYLFAIFYEGSKAKTHRSEKMSRVETAREVRNSLAEISKDLEQLIHGQSKNKDMPDDLRQALVYSVVEVEKAMELCLAITRGEK